MSYLPHHLSVSLNIISYLVVQGNDVGGIGGGGSDSDLGYGGVQTGTKNEGKCVLAVIEVEASSERQRRPSAGGGISGVVGGAVRD